MAVKKVGARKSGAGKTVGLGIIAAAAVATGLYFYGKGGKRHRAQVAVLANKAKSEVVSKLKKAKKVNRAVYNSVVSSVIKKYSALKNMDKSEFGAIARDLKNHWKKIELELKKELKKSSQKK